jgi:hypothetical protein
MTTTENTENTEPIETTSTMKEVVSTETITPIVNKYAILCEQNKNADVDMYFFIKYNGNEKELKNLSDAVDHIDWDFEYCESSFSTDITTLVSEQTAKEMTLISVGEYYHHKYDGVLQHIDFDIKKNDSEKRKMKKINKVLGDVGIANFIDMEDTDGQGDNESESDGSGDSESDEVIEKVERPSFKKLPPSVLNRIKNQQSQSKK